MICPWWVFEVPCEAGNQHGGGSEVIAERLKILGKYRQ
jgi:hypothetical protein